MPEAHVVKEEHREEEVETALKSQCVSRTENSKHGQSAVSRTKAVIPRRAP
jgi:hypothetical protein